MYGRMIAVWSPVSTASSRGQLGRSYVDVVVFPEGVIDFCLWHPTNSRITRLTPRFFPLEPENYHVISRTHSHFPLTPSSSSRVHHPTSFLTNPFPHSSFPALSLPSSRRFLVHLRSQRFGSFLPITPHHYHAQETPYDGSAEQE